MNRRSLLAALIGLPATARISVADVKPSDVIVVECDDYLSADTMDRIKAYMGNVWPGRKVVVCDKGVHIKIAAESNRP